MNMYLNNTNLISKRTVFASSEDSQRLKLEQSGSDLSSKRTVSASLEEPQRLKSELSGNIVNGLHGEIAKESPRISTFIATTSCKRQFSDDGQWWLPVDVPVTRRTRWPTSTTTRRSRRGWWSRSTDPGSAENNLKEHNKNKAFWKRLCLTSNVVSKNPTVIIDNLTVISSSIDHGSEENGGVGHKNVVVGHKNVVEGHENIGGARPVLRENDVNVRPCGP